MGGALTTSYEKQRRQLRQALILEVTGSANNKNTLQNLHKLRSLVTENDYICKTAAREKENKFDHSATTKEGLFRELDRLFTVFETGRILKSAKMRCGVVACPIGHHMTSFEDLEEHPICDNKNPPTCNICDKKTKSGFTCSYCEYNLCKMCSSVYCTFGHEMKMWTNAESDCACVICKNHPVYSGYRCTICDDYDICDMCTYKDGRQAIAKTILVRMEDNLSYMRKHINESYTSNHTVTNLKVTIGGGEGSYPTIWHMVQFANELHVLRATSVLEVLQSRIANEINRFRNIITIHPDLCKTAEREVALQEKYPYPLKLVADDFFTTKEVSRLRALVASHFKAKSSLVRNKGCVACPLGHLAHQFKRVPPTYVDCAIKKGMRNAEGITYPVCHVCDRLAYEGYHCTFCEYDLCQTCSTIYCSEGHEMIMWTIPEARAQRCYVCAKEDLTQGYHCKKCFINLCDMCTRKERRLNVRRRWDEELEELMAYMHEQRYKSDMAKWYHWRNKSSIVSLGLLCETVRELRVNRYKASKQVKFKPYIDKMKLIRADLCVNADVSATAAREASRNTGPDGFFFKTKPQAQEELSRLEKVIEDDIAARMVDRRQGIGVACPLGHGMALVRDISEVKFTEKKKEKVIETDEGNMDVTDAFASAFESINEDAVSVATSADGKELVNEGDYIEAIETFEEGVLHIHYHKHLDEKSCKVCQKQRLPINSYTCTICEYDLCQDCGVLYCKKGHTMQIWTQPEALNVSCGICLRPKLIMGYRCNECGFDMCDRCTMAETRNTMKLWPSKEIKRLYSLMDVMKGSSDIAMEMYERYQIYLENGAEKQSVSVVCKLLQEMQTAKEEADMEIAEKKRQYEEYSYGVNATDW